MILTAAAALSGRIDLGDVPAWGSFITTLGAFIAALWAGRTAHKLYERESERDQRAEEDRRERAEEQRRSQAVAVCAWFGRAGEGYGGLWCAIVRNASQSPVHEMVVKFYHRGTDGEFELRTTVDKDVVPPTDPTIAVLPTAGLTVESTRTDEYGDPIDEEDFDEFAVAIEFTDAAGLRWERDVRGRLTQVG
ncbi:MULTISPECIES: hypothetical protein [unclassified Micromonospora]|uniref:hypothetical protein n=1 Tax=unclassified Micromonospora TaxID=2617518 RepID=UPI002FF3CC1D